MIPSSLGSSIATPKILCLALEHIEPCICNQRRNICMLQFQKYILRTCTVIPSVFQPFQPIDEQIQDLLSFLGSQTVHVSENTAHDSVYSIFQLRINSRLSRNQFEVKILRKRKCILIILPIFYALLIFRSMNKICKNKFTISSKHR